MDLLPLIEQYKDKEKTMKLNDIMKEGDFDDLGLKNYGLCNLIYLEL